MAAPVQFPDEIIAAGILVTGPVVKTFHFPFIRNPFCIAPRILDMGSTFKALILVSVKSHIDPPNLQI